MTIRTILVDDEPLATQGLQLRLQAHDDVEVIGTAANGREALREIKADPDLRRIPIVVLTTSKAEEDIYRTYDLGANSFITKPVSFDGLVNVMRDLGRYWIEIVEPPPARLV